MNSNTGLSKSGRYAFIDVLRACAACVVLFQHGGEHAGLFSATTGFGPWINFGEVGVLAFFLVSGFVIPLSLEHADSLSEFWKHRIFRIYPLYLAVLAYEVVVNLTGHGDYIGSVHNWPALLISHVFLIQEYTHSPNFISNSWTLSLEFAWYILLSIMLLGKCNKRSVLLTTITVGGLLAVSALSVILHLRIPLGRFGIMASCVVGLLFYRLHTGELQWRTFIVLLAAIIGAIVVALYVAFGIFSHPNTPFLMVLISWSVAYALFAICYAARDSEFMKDETLLAIGTISYSIYLIHPTVQEALHATGLRGWTYMVVLMSATVLLSRVTYRYIEKPGIDYSKRPRGSKFQSA